MGRKAKMMWFIFMLLMTLTLDQTRGLWRPKKESRHLLSDWMTRYTSSVMLISLEESRQEQQLQLLIAASCRTFVVTDWCH